MEELDDKVKEIFPRIIQKDQRGNQKRGFRYLKSYYLDYRNKEQ